MARMARAVAHGYSQGREIGILKNMIEPAASWVKMDL
jgi:hypothetical protein